MSNVEYLAICVLDEEENYIPFSNLSNTNECVNGCFALPIYKRELYEHCSGHIINTQWWCDKEVQFVIIRKKNNDWQEHVLSLQFSSKNSLFAKINDVKVEFMLSVKKEPIHYKDRSGIKFYAEVKPSNTLLLEYLCVHYGIIFVGN